jgi:hypothetical protein
MQRLKLEYDKTSFKLCFQCVKLRPYGLGQYSDAVQSFSDVMDSEPDLVTGRSLHSFIFQLNLSRV